MLITQLPVGPLATNCYLVRESEEHSELVVIDPGAEAEAILQAVADCAGRVVAVACTHGHPDHTGALREVALATGAAVYIHPADRDLLRTAWPEYGVAEPPLTREMDLRLLREGDVLSFGSGQLRALHTPGHSPGAICLVDEELAFTGDTLFAGGVGRTDLPGGDGLRLAESLRRLMQELSPITLLYPGHGQSSVLTQELASNPWLVNLAAGGALAGD